MRTVIVYYSFSGVTRTIAEHIRVATGCDLLEVRARKPYSGLTAYLLGTFRARRGRADPIEPAEIDVGAYDLVVLGTPVWGGRPAPAMNGAIRALANAGGKTSVLYATCGSGPGETLGRMREALRAKGVRVSREFAFSTRALQDPSNVQALITRITAGDAAPAGG